MVMKKKEIPVEEARISKYRKRTTQRYVLWFFSLIFSFLILFAIAAFAFPELAAGIPALSSFFAEPAGTSALHAAETAVLPKPPSPASENASSTNPSASESAASANPSASVSAASVSPSVQGETVVPSEAVLPEKPAPATEFAPPEKSVVPEKSVTPQTSASPEESIPPEKIVAPEAPIPPPSSTPVPAMLTVTSATDTTGPSLSLSSGMVRQGDMVAVWLDGIPEGDPAYADIRFKASWLKNPIKADLWNGYWVALIQATTTISPNTYSVRALQILKDASGNDLPGAEIPGTKVLISIVDRKFEQQIFSVSKELEETRSQENLNTDGEKVAKAKANGSTVPIWDSHFLMPIPGQAAKAFGKQRIINGKLNYTHSGVDISGKTGTPILAPAAGRVVFSGPLIVSGNTVILDHGLGMFSSLVHMSRTNAEVGQQVTPGEVVGYVGDTGFATGPHLHWTLTVHGNVVDPEYLIAHDPLSALRSGK